MKGQPKELVSSWKEEEEEQEEEVIAGVHLSDA